MKKFFSFVAAILFASSMMAGTPLNTNFADGLGNWTIKDVRLGEISYVWSVNTNYGYAKASAYVGGKANAAESWLISPAFDLKEATEATLKINHALNKGTNTVLSVKASIDGTNWDNLTISEWPAGTSWDFLDATADLTAYAGKENVQVAFVYASTTDVCPTWEIKTVIVSDDAEGDEVVLKFVQGEDLVMWWDLCEEEGYWQIEAFNEECEVSISNVERQSAPGTYLWEDLDPKWCYIANETDTIYFTDGSCKVSCESDTVKVIGSFMGTNSTIYYIDILYAEPKANDTVKVNIEEGKMDTEYAEDGLVAFFGMLNDKSFAVQLALWFEEDFVGDYTEEDLDFIYFGSGLYADGAEQEIFSAEIKIVPGNMEGEYLLTAGILCYNNVLYIVCIKIPATQDINEVISGIKASKIMVNGQLLIEKNNAVYNVNGARVR